jgi:hypothetical protein
MLLSLCDNDVDGVVDAVDSSVLSVSVVCCCCCCSAFSSTATAAIFVAIVGAVLVDSTMLGLDLDDLDFDIQLRFSLVSRTWALAGWILRRVAGRWTANYQALRMHELIFINCSSNVVEKKYSRP